MKSLRYIVPALLITFGSSAALQAGPGVEYFNRVDSVARSAKVTRTHTEQTTTAKCKLTEIVRVTTGPHGTPTHQVVSTSMDCSDCNDSSMACCAGKTKS